MKKIIILIFVVLVIVCIAAFTIINNKRVNSNKLEENSNINVVDNSSIIDNTNEVPTIEIRGKKYKDINYASMSNVSFDNSLVYAEPTREGEESYIKLSDDFFLNDSKNVQTEEAENRSVQIEMLPSKIFYPDENASFLYKYGDEVFFIPVEKCNSGEEKIVYRDYGLEVIRKNDSIKIKDKVVEDVIVGWDLRDVDFSSAFDDELRFDDVSLCEAYMESWKISDKKMEFYDNRDSSYIDFEKRMLESQAYTNIYQVDFDDSEDSLEFIYTSGILDHVHIDSTYPYYSIVSYDNRQSQGIRIFKEGMLWFNNILNYKNVFYGFDVFEYGPKVDKLILINENIITGYYIYDKEQGLIHVDRFANGEKFDETGFKKLSEVCCTLDAQHTIKKDTDGTNRIDAFPMYDGEYLMDENGELILNEEGSYIENPNSEIIESGTKIFIKSISEDGYAFTFTTEDGTEYRINYYYT